MAWTLLPAPQDAPAAAASASPLAAELAAELAALVDRPTATERARAAATAAQRANSTVDDWLAACAAFAATAAEPALRTGPNVVKVPLQVLDRVEDTELHVYVPAAAQGRRAPCLLWGHGAGGNGEGQYRWFQDVADKLGIAVLAPTEFGQEPGWGFTPRERQAQLAALRWLRRHQDVAEDAVFVGGASRGGHMTWDLLLRQPDLFAAALPCIGGPRLQIGVQNNLRYLESVATVPIRDLQGSKDDPLLLANLHLCFERLKKLGGDQQLIEFADRGHDFDLAAVDLAAFFALRRPAQRTAIVRTAAVAGEARSGWAEILAFEPGVQETFDLRVGQGQWDRLDEAGKRAFVLDQAIQHTARLQCTMTAPGKFTLTGRGVQRARLLLTDAMLGPDGKVTVQWQGRAVVKKPARSAKVLLTEFAERFDRTFLPVAEVLLP